MGTVDKHILSFLSEHTVASIALLDANSRPYSVSCFYAFEPERMCLLFKSSFGTHHDNLIHEGAPVSGTILPEKLDLAMLKGIQFTGKLMSLQEAGNLRFSSLYTQKYMMSLALPGYMWGAELTYIKLTDNSLGFGHKTSWGQPG